MNIGEEAKYRLLECALHCVSENIPFELRIDFSSILDRIEAEGIYTYTDWDCFDEKTKAILELRGN